MTPIAVIMAGGRGERLCPLTDKVPKPPLSVGASSIIDGIIASLVPVGMEDVFLAVNYQREVFGARRRAEDLQRVLHDYATGEGD